MKKYPPPAFVDHIEAKITGGRSPVKVPFEPRIEVTTGPSNKMDSAYEVLIRLRFQICEMMSEHEARSMAPTLNRMKQRMASRVADSLYRDVIDHIKELAEEAPDANPLDMRDDLYALANSLRIPL